MSVGTWQRWQRKVGGATHYCGSNHPGNLAYTVRRAGSKWVCELGVRTLNPWSAPGAASYSSYQVDARFARSLKVARAWAEGHPTVPLGPTPADLEGNTATYVAAWRTQYGTPAKAKVYL